MKRHLYLLGPVLGIGLIAPAYAADLAIPRALRTTLANRCAQFQIDPKASQPTRAVTLPPAAECKPVVKNGLPLPDPACSPGAVNPTVTVAVLTATGFTTDCLRDKATSANRKEVTYQWYKIPKPAHNSGQGMVCELDHIISLEIGGADTLENIWPQCGPSRAVLRNRFFKQKDAVEHFLAGEVAAHRMALADVQRGIAEDWTQFLPAARQAAAVKKKKKGPRARVSRRPSPKRTIVLFPRHDRIGQRRPHPRAHPR
jgi:hypothetical protein